jgi:hypothetical protein
MPASPAPQVLTPTMAAKIGELERTDSSLLSRGEREVQKMNFLSAQLSAIRAQTGLDADAQKWLYYRLFYYLTEWIQKDKRLHKDRGATNFERRVTDIFEMLDADGTDEFLLKADRNQYEQTSFAYGFVYRFAAPKVFVNFLKAANNIVYSALESPTDDGAGADFGSSAESGVKFEIETYKRLHEQLLAAAQRFFEQAALCQVLAEVNPTNQQELDTMADRVGEALEIFKDYLTKTLFPAGAEPAGSYTRWQAYMTDFQHALTKFKTSIEPRKPVATAFQEATSALVALNTELGALNQKCKIQHSTVKAAATNSSVLEAACGGFSDAPPPELKALLNLNAKLDAFTKALSNEFKAYETSGFLRLFYKRDPGRVKWARQVRRVFESLTADTTNLTQRLDDTSGKLQLALRDVRQEDSDETRRNGVRRFFRRKSKLQDLLSSSVSKFTTLKRKHIAAEDQARESSPDSPKRSLKR